MKGLDVRLRRSSTIDLTRWFSVHLNVSGYEGVGYETGKAFAGVG